MTDTTLVHARTRHLWQELGDEGVILDLDAGTYFGLNAVGRLVWKQIQSPCTLAMLRQSVMAEFDVDAKRCDLDLRALLQAFAARGMIDMDAAA